MAAWGAYNSCGKKRQKQGLIALAIMTMIVLIIPIYLMIEGSQLQSYGQDLKQNSSSEQCEVVDIDFSDCEDDVSKQTVPDYTMISKEKCGIDMKLSQVEENKIGCTHKDDVYSINRTINCYVHNECDYYALNEYQDMIKSGNDTLITGIVVLCVVIFVWMVLGLSCLLGFWSEQGCCYRCR